MNSIPFQFEAPIVFFEKASERPGEQRRIAGIISTETRDRQGEIVLQRGLDFKEFLDNGWFNDNHSKLAKDVVGFPKQVKLFAKGAALPDGSQACSNCTWVEGHLLDTEKGNEFWELGRALQKTDRRLGYSIEGQVEKRTGPDRKTIARARIKHVAVTHVPVNTDSRLETIAKSLMVMEETSDEAIDQLAKTLTVGNPGGSPPSGPYTGAGAAAVLATQSLEGAPPSRPDGEPKKKKKKNLTKSEVQAYLEQRYGRADTATTDRVIALTQSLKATGRL